jgi:secreted trypsin-like serine protease
VKLVMTGIPTPSGGKRNSGCSGALISRQWIITAGHCFRDANGVRVEHPVADLTSATLGKADLTNGGGVVRTVIAVRQSPDRDIAVAELDRPVWGVEPLRLATTAPAAGDTLRLTGWGADNSANPVQSMVLRTGQFTVSSVSPAIVGVKGLAPKPDTSACPYDSGAPYFQERRHLQPVLVGIEANGPSCPHALEETTARVDTAAEWIRAAIR